MAEASRIEVDAVLDKVETLKTAASRRRRLSEALEELKADPVPSATNGKK